MGDVVHEVQARDVLFVQEIDRLGLALAEDRDQDVGPRDLFPAGGLHMEDGPLQHALEAQGRLGVPAVEERQERCGLADEGRQILA